MQRIAEFTGQHCQHLTIAFVFGILSHESLSSDWSVQTDDVSPSYQSSSVSSCSRFLNSLSNSRLSRFCGKVMVSNINILDGDLHDSAFVWNLHDACEVWMIGLVLHKHRCVAATAGEVVDKERRRNVRCWTVKFMTGNLRHVWWDTVGCAYIRMRRALFMFVSVL